MQRIRFIEGDQVVYELLADVLFSSAVYLVFQTSPHTFPRVNSHVKHFVKPGYVPFSNSHILSVNFCVHKVRTMSLIHNDVKK